MEQVMVSVCLPAFCRTELLLLPADMTWRSMLPQLCSQLRQVLPDGAMGEDELPVLCQLDTHALIDLDRTVRESDVHNGTRLLLC